MCDATARQTVVLPLDESSPMAARAWLKVVSCGTHVSHLLDDATLLVSELVTNAVKHGGPPVVLAVDCDGKHLEVRVRDGSSDLPVPRTAAPTEESGRGYLLLDELSHRWGVEQEVDGADGKEVWFLLGAAPPS